MILLNKKQSYYIKKSLGKCSNQSLFNDALDNISHNIEQQASQENPSHRGVKVGDIFRTSWGYDQTNIDFYEVTKLIGKHTILIKELNQERNPGDYEFTGVTIPIKGEYVEGSETLRKRIQKSGYDGGLYVKIIHSICARPWDGSPERYSSYA
tara:strand:+ start:757 stop:1215 length:459 start_codon:yes stop_codon:yes gene_type:complete